MSRHVDPTLKTGPSRRMTFDSPLPASAFKGAARTAPADIPEHCGVRLAEDGGRGGRLSTFRWYGPMAFFVLLPSIVAGQDPSQMGLAPEEAVLRGRVMEPSFPSEGIGQTDGEVGVTYLFYVRTIDRRAVLVVSDSPPPDPGVPVEIRGRAEMDPLGERVVTELSRRTDGDELEEWEVVPGEGEPLIDPPAVGGIPWLWVAGGMAVGALPLLVLLVLERSRNGAAPVATGPDYLMPGHFPHSRAADPSHRGTRRLGSGGMT